MTHSTNIDAQPAALEPDVRSRETGKTRQARGLHEPAKEQAVQTAPTRQGCPAAKINTGEAKEQTDKP